MTNTAGQPRKRLTMHQRQNLVGWLFLLPATILIIWLRLSKPRKKKPGIVPMCWAFAIFTMAAYPT